MADRGHLQTQAHELVKQYIVYDVSFRPEYVYTVRQDAANGTPCSAVRYAYDNDSSRIVYMKEFTSVWNSSWEVF